MPILSATSRCFGGGLSSLKRWSTRSPMVAMLPAYPASWENPNNTPSAACPEDLSFLAPPARYLRGFPHRFSDPRIERFPSGARTSASNAQLGRGADTAVIPLIGWRTVFAASA